MSAAKQCIAYFLGANSAEGFVSLYDQWVDQRTIQAFYTIKGGAGCGKSTLMRRVADRMEQEGYEVEYICCSGDPDSLDGIRIPEKGAAMVDGTAPHVLDPAYTGATGHYIDLGAGYDRTSLFAIREEIVSAVQAYRACYPPAYRCIRGAKDSWDRGRKPLRTQETLDKTAKRAQTILKRELKGTREGRGTRHRRFLSGVTCQGKLLLEGTVQTLCREGYQIRDEYGLAGDLLACLEQGFLDRGYDVVACPSGVDPGRLAHLLIPDRSLAFVTGKVPGADFRTIRTESLVEKEAMQEGRSFLRLSNRVAAELLKEGTEHLAQAKENHDILEELYHPYVDFSLAQEMAEKITREILNLPDTVS
ncbi:MAG: hypothetical protein IKU62_08505 [Ruminiclostridium sp.]|nr:hypothetical protein [Ruminiclostridium sp.]